MWASPPPALPVTVTLYVPSLPEVIFRIEEAELFDGTVTLPLLKEKLSPEGTPVADRLTPPE